MLNFYGGLPLPQTPETLVKAVISKLMTALARRKMGYFIGINVF